MGHSVKIYICTLTVLQVKRDDQDLHDPAMGEVTFFQCLAPDKQFLPSNPLAWLPLLVQLSSLSLFAMGKENKLTKLHIICC